MSIKRCDQCKQLFIKDFLFEVNKEKAICQRCLEKHEQYTCQNCKKMLVEDMSNQFAGYS